MATWTTELLHALKHLGWAGALGVSLGLALGSFALAAILVVRWPTTRFKDSASPPRLWARSHPVIRVAGLVAKNIAGVVVIALGVIMAIPGVPGQGALLILIGLTLVDFPGKLRLEGRLIRRPAVRRVVNSLRARFGHAALELD